MTDKVNNNSSLSRRQRYGIAKYIQINNDDNDDNDDDDANVKVSGDGGDDDNNGGGNERITAIELILLLPEIKKVSAGRYTCVALNAIGTNENHTYVNILGESYRICMYRNLKYQTKNKPKHKTN